MLGIGHTLGIAFELLSKVMSCVIFNILSMYDPRSVTVVTIRYFHKNSNVAMVMISKQRSNTNPTNTDYKSKSKLIKLSELSIVKSFDHSSSHWFFLGQEPVLVPNGGPEKDQRNSVVKGSRVPHTGSFNANS